MKTAVMAPVIDTANNYAFFTQHSHQQQQQQTLTSPISQQRFASPVRSTSPAPSSAQTYITTQLQQAPTAASNFIASPTQSQYIPQLQQAPHTAYIAQAQPSQQQQQQQTFQQFAAIDPNSTPAFYTNEVAPTLLKQQHQQSIQNPNLIYAVQSPRSLQPQPQQQQQQLQQTQFMIQSPPSQKQQVQQIQYAATNSIPEVRQFTQVVQQPQLIQQHQQQTQLLHIPMDQQQQFYVQPAPVHHSNFFQQQQQQPQLAFSQAPIAVAAQPISHQPPFYQTSYEQQVPSFNQQHLESQPFMHSPHHSLAQLPSRPAFSEYNRSHYEIPHEVDPETRLYIDNKFSNNGYRGQFNHRNQLQRHQSTSYIPQRPIADAPPQQYFATQYQPVENRRRLGSPQREFIDREPIPTHFSQAAAAHVRPQFFNGNSLHGRAVSSHGVFEEPVGYHHHPQFIERSPRMVIHQNPQFLEQDVEMLKARDIGYIFEKRIDDYLKEYFQAIIDIEREVESNRFKLVKQDDYSVQLFYEFFDAQEQGQIQAQDILRGLSKLGINADVNDVHLLIQRYSLSKISKLDQQEFVNMVVPQTYKHIDAIYIRKPYISERNLKEETKGLMTKVMKGLLNAEVVLESLRQKIANQNINLRELFACIQENKSDPINRQNLRDFLMKIGIFVNKEEIIAVMKRFDSKDMGFFREQDFQVELTPRMR